MIEATNSQRLSVLQKMGISWYVPNDFKSEGFTVETLTEALVEPSEQALEEAVVSEVPAVVLEGLAAEKPIVAAPAVAVQDEVQIPVVAAVKPFHWLIARAGFVNFICDIKQERLPPVWHTAAQELLGDIAIAMGVQERFTSQYFSWPPSGANATLGDGDLPDFLGEYLDSDGENTLFILMGDSAQLHAKPVALKGAPSVSCVALGQLFRDQQQKKTLWQQLKPLRR